MVIDSKLIAYIKLTIVIIIWGSVYHVAKYLVQETDIYTVAFIRFFISAIVLIFMYRRKHRRILIQKLSKHWLLLFLTGFFGVFVYTTIFFSAEILIPATQIAILFSFAPCITVLLGRYFLKQHIPISAYCGILIALCGTIAVVNLNEPSCGGRIICTGGLVNHLSIGQVLALCSALVMSIYNVLIRKLATLNVDSLTITTFATIFGCLILFINFLFFGDKVLLLFHKPLMFWLAMIYTSVLATAICYNWFSAAICSIGVGQSAVFLNGVPLAAVLIGVVLGDVISLSTAFAGLVIILGVVITNYTVNNYQKS